LGNTHSASCQSGASVNQTLKHAYFIADSHFLAAKTMRLRNVDEVRLKDNISDRTLSDNCQREAFPSTRKIHPFGGMTFQPSRSNVPLKLKNINNP